MVNINRIRHAAWTLVAFCLASSLAAQSYDPHILKSEVIVLDAKAIESHANSKTPFELVLGKTPLTVVLWPAPLWPEKGLPVLEVGRGGDVKERIVQGSLTYAGDIAGEDPAESEVRLTIVRGVLEGYVLSSTGWWFIEPLSRFDPKAAPEQYLVYEARDVDYAVDYGHDGVKMDRVLAGDSPVTDPRIPVAMVADLDYVNQSGPGFEWIERQAALLNNVSGIYKDQFGRELWTPKGVADLGGQILTSTDHLVLLNQIVDIVVLAGGLNGLDSEIAHLTTAKNLPGDVLGVAGRGENFGLTQQSTSCAFRNMIIAAHEIGHNFNGGHEQADRWCAFTSNGICVYWQQTILWRTFHSSTVGRFSDGTPISGRNNAALICTNLASRGFPCLQP